MTAAPMLADIVVNGKPVKAVAQATKQGFLYVFDRVTGKPVWPIEERPVPQTDVPGEKYRRHSPSRQTAGLFAQRVLRERSHRLHAGAQGACLEAAKRFRLGPVFLPPVVSKAEGPIGALTSGTLSGGVNWPGSGVRSGNARLLHARVQLVHLTARSRRAAERIL